MQTSSSFKHVGPNRRDQSRQSDGWYKVAVAINLIAWVVLIAALITFHFARPEFIAGFQRYWQMPEQNQWSAELVTWLFILLQVGGSLTLLAIGMRWRRNRRRHDEFGINLFVLMGLGLIGLLTLLYNVS